ncbi:MAG: hypothetical protein KDB82_10640 [Planctomycetes bacterium]|nr:hypothetical protein [Planctomycetota bacterium]
MKPPVATLLLAMLCFAPMLHAQDLAEDPEPTVPLIELKQVNEHWKWLHDGREVQAADLPKLLQDFASYKNEEGGWEGIQQQGGSTNVLIVHVDGEASESLLWNMLTMASQAGLQRVAIANSLTAKPPAPGRAPDPAELDESYVQFLGATGSGEEAVVKLDDSTTGFTFVVGVGKQGRVVADGTAGSSDDIVLKATDAPDERAAKLKKRKKVIDDLVEAIVRAIELSPEPVKSIRVEKREPERKPGQIDSMKPEADTPAPWAWYDLAARACRKLNEARTTLRKAPYTVSWPYQPRARGAVAGPVPTPGRGEADYYLPRRKGPDEVREDEDRILAALNWLKDHQNREGYWSATGFAKDSTRLDAKKTGNAEFTKDCTNDIGWEATCDIGLTGLAILAFTGNGYDHKYGDYRATIRQAVLYLRKVQDNDGCFGNKEDDHWVYNHAICTAAIAEVYGLTGDQVLKPIVGRAVDLILKAQNPGLGWRYGVQPGINDTSVTCWMVMAVHAAKMAGIEIDQTKSYSDAAAWFDMITVNVNGYPKCGYDSPGSNNARLRSAQNYDHNPTMDAMYVNAMLAMGKADTEDKTVKALARGCVEDEYLPKWEMYKIDFYYWYEASHALCRVGGSGWKTWQQKGFKVIRDHQRGFSDLDKDATAKTLDEYGSWDPVSAWGSAGGRVYSTAMGALCLETPWSGK